jgi:hypothetical protein
MKAEFRIEFLSLLTSFSSLWNNSVDDGKLG